MIKKTITLEQLEKLLNVKIAKKNGIKSVSHGVDMDTLESEGITIEFNVDEKEHNIQTWDYSHWKSMGYSIPFVQTDWNQTLVTKINEMAKKLVEKDDSKLIPLEVHYSLKLLFNSLVSYDMNTKTLFETYAIDYVSEIDEDTIMFPDNKILKVVGI